MTVRVRHVKQPYRRWVPWTLLALVLGGGYAAMQYGTKWSTGEWMPGGQNPATVLIEWGKAGAEWHPESSVLMGVLVVFIVLLFFLFGLVLGRQRRKREHIDAKAQYLGDGAEMTLKAVTEHAREASLTIGDVVGLAIVKCMQTAEWMWAGFRETMCAIMGPGSGKTSALVIPMALDAPGPVWITSNRNDVVAAIAHARKVMHPDSNVWVFDPQDVAGMPAAFRWDPLSYIIGADGNTAGAEVRASGLAKMFAEAARPIDTKTDSFFDPAGQQLLGNFLLAAKLGGFQITKAFDWLATSKEEAEPVGILWKAGFRMQADAVRSKYRIHDKTKGSIFETTSGMISFLQNQPALPWIVAESDNDDRPLFDPAAFVRSKADTMICLSREGHMSFGPIIAALTTAVLEAAEAYAKTCPGGRLPVPFVLPLDEVANVCRIKILPELMSHAGGRGIFVMPILQSRAQGKMCWGDNGMEALWGASTIKILGRGIAEVQVLKDWSDLVGPMEVITHSRSTSSGRGGGSRSDGEHRSMEPILTPAEIGKLPKWRALVSASGSEVALAQLVPYWQRSKEMNALVTESKAVYGAGGAIAVDAEKVAA